MNWNPLKTVEQLNELDAGSHLKPRLIYKHSTRCGISSIVMQALESNKELAEQEKLLPYYLDVISDRDLSNAIASRYGIKHQSPQAILIYKGEVLYQNSHYDIKASEILKTLERPN